MSALHECPKCGVLMEHQESEPDVGIEGAWVCDHCSYALPDDSDED